MLNEGTLGPRGPAVGRPGGQGRVYSLQAHPELLLKVYHDGLKIDVSELEEIIDWLKQLPPHEQHLVEKNTAWPQEVISCRGGAVGVVFKRAPSRFFHSLSGSSEVRSLTWAYSKDACRFQGLMVPKASTRAELVLRVAEIFSLFQSRGLVYSDVSGSNILWSANSRPEIFVIDCDATEIAGRRGVPSGVTPFWACPWGYAAMEDMGYKLGLLTLRTLFCHEGPISVTTKRLELPHDPPVPAQLVELLTMALGRASATPDPSHWIPVLTDLKDGLELREL